MATTFEGVLARVIGVAVGSLWAVVGVGSYVWMGLFADNVPLPGAIERAVLDVVPQLGAGSTTVDLAGLAVLGLFCLVMVGLSLWTVGKALFQSDYSITIKSGSGSSYHGH